MSRSQLFARKPMSMLYEEMKGENRLRRVLGPVQLTALGVGAVIGTGIFVLTGVAAPTLRQWPLIELAFFVALVAAAWFGLLDSRPPVAPSTRLMSEPDQGSRASA